MAPQAGTAFSSSTSGSFGPRTTSSSISNPTPQQVNSLPSFSTFQGPEGTSVVDLGGGVKVVIPQAVDFGALKAPFVDFGKALDQALKTGQQSANTYFNDVGGNKARDVALGLVNTDVQGIKSAVDQLAPLSTQYGNKDTQTNIARANEIDAANFNRFPAFNTFNEGQVAGINQFNAAQHEAAVNASGLNYSQRISQVLNDLRSQESGNLSNPLLNTLMTQTARNAGAGIAASSGVSALSGAGRNVEDKLDINQRIQLALDAEKTIPSVLTQGQSVLQPPTLQYSGVLASPTGVPLNPSNIGDRIPITSSVSAGQAQLQVGTNAAQLETIPAGQVLQSGLQTAEYNATGAFNTQLTKFSAGQAQLQAVDSAVQGGFDNVLAGDIRQQQYAQFQSGLQQAQSSANTQAAGSIIGGIGSALLSSPSGQSFLGNIGSAVSGAFNSIFGGGGTAEVAGGGVGAGIGGGPIGAGAGREQASVQMGSASVPNSAIQDFAGQANNFFKGSPDTNIPSSIGGQAVVGDAVTPNGSPGFQLASGEVVPQEGNTGLPDFFKNISSGLSDSGVDSSTLSKSAGTVANWKGMNAPQQMSASSNIALDVLQNKGIVTPQQANAIGTAQTALMTLANPDATPSQRATALLTAGASASTLPYTGSITAPNTINGAQVLASTTTTDGQPGFQLADGNIVPQSSLLATSNTVAGVQAFGILTDPNATVEQKTLALTSVGVNAASANDIITQVAGGNLSAGLSVINTGANWNAMSPAQQAVSVMQTSYHVMNAMNAAGVGTESFAGTGASVLGSTSATGAAATGSGITGGVGLSGITAGAYTGYLQLQGVKNFLQGDKLSLKEQTALVPLTGGFSFLSGPIQKIADSVFGSGKNSSQKARDNWRNNLVTTGLADKENGTMYVNLTNGSKYNIGMDGSNKLKNLDGTDRYTYDVDWGNQAAVSNIPEAHLFALASGLDPTTNQGKDLFNKSVAQSLNAASSNATTTEGIRGNFKSMMQKTDPNALAMHLETLRATNKISDDEYGVYINTINQTFGTELSPLDRAKSMDFMIQSLQSENNPSKADKQLLETLQDPSQLTENEKELKKRLKQNG